jgi:hypothetical protein
VYSKSIYLDDGHVAVRLQDGALADLTVAQGDVDDLGIARELQEGTGLVSQVRKCASERERENKRAKAKGL